eukprot:6061122-Amphidinium_carterae.1
MRILCSHTGVIAGYGALLLQLHGALPVSLDYPSFLAIIGWLGFAFCCSLFEVSVLDELLSFTKSPVVAGGGLAVLC